MSSDGLRESTSWRKAVKWKRESLLLGFLLGCCFTASYGQEQLPALTPMAQGGGQASGRIALVQGSSEGSMGALTERPIFPGETVHISVFGAPDFSTVMQVSDGGNIAVPIVGAVHIEGLDSLKAGQLIEAKLRALNLVLDPHVSVTVESPDTGITVLGEVHSPGIYRPTGKHQLADILAAAGGLTANTGRVIEISNDDTPDKKIDLAWDPTMHDTSNYEYIVHPGDRVYVRACGIAYVGGHVAKPGAYSLCGSPTMSLSEIVAMAGGVVPFTSTQKTFLIRTQTDGSRTAAQFDLKRVLTGKEGDPSIRENDIIYVSPSPLKAALNQAITWAMGTSSELLYVYRP